MSHLDGTTTQFLGVCFGFGFGLSFIFLAALRNATRMRVRPGNAHRSNNPRYLHPLPLNQIVSAPRLTALCSVWPLLQEENENTGCLHIFIETFGASGNSWPHGRTLCRRRLAGCYLMSQDHSIPRCFARCEPSVLVPASAEEGLSSRPDLPRSRAPAVPDSCP